MAKLVVMTNPVPGKEDAYNAWYDNVHVPDLLTIPGFAGAQRFRLKTGVDTWQYLCIYEIEGDDPAAAVADMRARLAAGEFERSDAIDVANSYLGLFEAR